MYGHVGLISTGKAKAKQATFTSIIKDSYFHLSYHFNAGCNVSTFKVWYLTLLLSSG